MAEVYHIIALRNLGFFFARLLQTVERSQSVSQKIMQ